MSVIRNRRHAQWITILFAVPILLFSGMGFIAKFLELINTFEGDAEGAFAVTPMVNYLLASAGFLCLLLWSTINGMFNDIEKPKQTMLEYDSVLDRNRDGEHEVFKN